MDKILDKTLDAKIRVNILRKKLEKVISTETTYVKHRAEQVLVNLW